MTGIYILAMLGLCWVAATRHRIWALCGFYFVYAVLKVVALGEVIEWRDLVLFQGLYVVLLGSLVIRWFQDETFQSQLRRWPKTYCLVVGVMYISALYSVSGHIFTAGDGNGLAPKLTIASLFVLAASQVQRTKDLKIFAGATVAVALALSVWVILAAATFDFEGMRGGIDVNQNFVSVFVLVGAIPLVYMLFNVRGWILAVTLALLLVVALTAFILHHAGCWEPSL